VIKPEKLLAQVCDRAKGLLDLRAVSERMRPFDCGCPVDPLFFWSLKKAPDPSEFLVLQDWYLEEPDAKPSGTVDQNVGYVEECFNKPCWKHDRTFHRLFHGEQSRPRIESGKCLALNAVWGLRRRKDGSDVQKPCGRLPDSIHVPSLGLWLWLATEMRPKRIYLAGSWARRGDEFGKDYSRGISVETYLNSWKIRKDPNATNVIEKAKEVLKETIFYSLYHPAFRPLKFEN
jgi:hypothetical protein